MIMVRTAGQFTLRGVQELGEFSVFVAAAYLRFFGQRHRLEKLVRAIHEIGVRCVPIVLFVGFFTGLVLGLQGYYTLVQFGSETALGSAVSLILVRELGPVLTALMITGQAGSALASELGIQRNDEQIDALRTMGLKADGFLVGPRLVAALICFPMLTALFDLVGIFGGYVSGSLLLGVDGGVYWARVYESVRPPDVVGGFVKALVFGILTISICAYRGFNTHRKSRSPGVKGVSESATRAVVWSSIAVLASDYVVTSFFL